MAAREYLFWASGQVSTTAYPGGKAWTGTTNTKHAMAKDKNPLNCINSFLPRKPLKKGTPFFAQGVKKRFFGRRRGRAGAAGKELKTGPALVLLPMFAALAKTLEDLLSNPFLVVPAGLLVLYQALLYYVFFVVFDTAPKFFYDVFALGETVNTGIFDSLAAFVLFHFNELLVVAFLSILWIAGFVGVLFAYSAAKKNPSAGAIGAVSIALSKAGKIIGTSFFMWVLVLLFLFGLGSAILLSVFMQGLELVFMIAFALILLAGVIVYLKIIFLPIVFFDSEKKIVQAMKLTDEFTKKRLAGIFLLVFVLAILSRFAGEIASTALDLIEIEPVAILLMLLVASIISAFTSLSIANYYYLAQR